MKKFALFGISKKYGKVSSMIAIETPDDFEPTELQEYHGKKGEELYTKSYPLSPTQKE